MGVGFLSVPRVWGRCPWSRLQDGSSQGQNRLCQVLEPVWVAITHRGAQCSFHGLFGRQGETLLPGQGRSQARVLLGPQKPRIDVWPGLAKQQGPVPTGVGGAGQGQPGGAGAVQGLFTVQPLGAGALWWGRAQWGPPEQAPVAGSGAAVGGRAANAQVRSRGVVQAYAHLQDPGPLIQIVRTHSAFLPQQFVAVGVGPGQFLHTVVIFAYVPGQVFLTAVIVQKYRSPIGREGASSPEAGAGHIGHGHAHAQVVSVVVGVFLGDGGAPVCADRVKVGARDRKSTRLNSSYVASSYAVF